MNDIREHAFTLAEVLITLGIIGVVAAIVMSALITNIQYSKNVAGLEKAYSVMATVTNQVFDELGNPRTEGWGNETRWTSANNAQYRKMVVDSYKDKLNVLADCRNPNGGDLGFAYPESPCLLNVNKLYKDLKGADMFYQGGSYQYPVYSYPLLTRDGILYMFYFGFWDVVQAAHPTIASNVGLDPVSYYSQGGVYAWIIVDVNGKKLPNQVGKDTFFLALTSRGIVPLGAEPDKASNYDCYKGGKGIMCAGKVIETGKMDYL
ncbi:MAG: type II secretion system GspH family protein [Heliobacteriaceae bacterium]|jgi:prepilin-type N-terminal cleavage/methylation domain-containing protein|nr:type II secretion system GspH family protein [Heliobacteriaceae bacterium]